MARVNVDDEFLADPRFALLVKLLGDDNQAIGMCVRAWFLAQHFWAKSKQLVPAELWSTGGFDPLISVGLAERRGTDVYCRGAKDQFGWLVREARVSAGQASAEARRKKFGTAVPPHARNLPSPGEGATEQTPNKLPNKTERTVRSCSKSVRRTPTEQNRTLSLYTGDKPESAADSEHLDSEAAKAIIQGPKAGDVWKAYEAVYFAKKGAPPIRNAKQMGICAQLVKRLGGDAAVGVVRFYLNHPSAYYLRENHSLGPCLKDCESLHTQMLTGRKVTVAQAAVTDRQHSNIEAGREALKLLEDRDAKK